MTNIFATEFTEFGEKLQYSLFKFTVIFCKVLSKVTSQIERLTSIDKIYLPPANEVWGKVMFLHLCVILFTGGEGVCSTTPRCRPSWGWVDPPPRYGQQAGGISGGSKVGCEGRAPPGVQNSFNFMQFLGKFSKIVCWCPPGSWRPLLGEILDPPLGMYSTEMHTCTLIKFDSCHQ